MSRLYGLDYDTDNWKITGDRQIGYRFIEKNSYETYRIPGDIIGIEQVHGSDNRFLIYGRYTRNEWLFMAVRLEKNVIINEYTRRFTEFCFLSADTIGFDLNRGSCSAVVYNINTNEECTPLSHYFSPDNELHDFRICQNRKIEMIYEKENEYPTYLLLTYKFLSSIDIGATLQFIVDPISFQIISPIYSGLWEKFIFLDEDDSSLELEDIASEHYIEAQKIGNFLEKYYGADSNKKIEDFLEIMR